MRSLRQVLAMLRGEEIPDEEPPTRRATPDVGVPDPSSRGRSATTSSASARAARAIEAAAAGGHHLYLHGPPGSGKTMLAERLAGLMPDLSTDESLEVSAVHSLAGLLTNDAELVTRPPFIAPHHTASLVSLVGGGSGVPRPGAISCAHRGHPVHRRSTGDASTDAGHPAPAARVRVRRGPSGGGGGQVPGPLHAGPGRESLSLWAIRHSDRRSATAHPRSSTGTANASVARSRTASTSSARSSPPPEAIGTGIRRVRPPLSPRGSGCPRPAVTPLPRHALDPQQRGPRPGPAPRFPARRHQPSHPGSPLRRRPPHRPRPRPSRPPRLDPRRPGGRTDPPPPSPTKPSNSAPAKP